MRWRFHNWISFFHTLFCALRKLRTASHCVLLPSCDRPASFWKRTVCGRHRLLQRYHGQTLSSPTADVNDWTFFGAKNSSCLFGVFGASANYCIQFSGQQVVAGCSKCQFGHISRVKRKKSKLIDHNINRLRFGRLFTKSSLESCNLAKKKNKVQKKGDVQEMPSEMPTHSFAKRTKRSHITGAYFRTLFFLPFFLFLRSMRTAFMVACLSGQCCVYRYEAHYRHFGFYSRKLDSCKWNYACIVWRNESCNQFAIYLWINSFAIATPPPPPFARVDCRFSIHAECCLSRQNESAFECFWGKMTFGKKVFLHVNHEMSLECIATQALTAGRLYTESNNSKKKIASIACHPLCMWSVEVIQMFARLMETSESSAQNECREQ